MPCTLKTASSIPELLFLFNKRQLDGFLNSWIENLSEKVSVPCQRFVRCKFEIFWLWYDTHSEQTSQSIIFLRSVHLDSTLLECIAYGLSAFNWVYKGLWSYVRLWGRSLCRAFFFSSRDLIFMLMLLYLVAPFGWGALRCAPSNR